MRKPVPVPWISPPQGGRPPKHGKEFRFAKPDTWGEPDTATIQVTDRHGTARAMAWDRILPRLTTRSARIGHTGERPIIKGTLIRLQVDRLPGDHEPGLAVAATPNSASSPGKVPPNPVGSPRPGFAGVQKPPPELALPGPCTETHQTIAERDQLRR